MDARQGNVSSNRNYEDIVPSHDLTQGDKADILNIDVTGFKKEQIKIQIDNYGKLRISGERPLQQNKWIRFRMDFQTPENCNTAEIRAKFENGRVLITLPKVVVEPVPPPKDQATQTTMPKPPSADQNGQHKKADGEEKEEKRSEPPPIEAQNKVEDKKPDQSDKHSESTSDFYNEAESTDNLTAQQKLSTRLRTFKQKAWEGAFGSRKAICSTFAVIVVSVSVGLIISSKLFKTTSGASGGSTDLIALITP